MYFIPPSRTELALVVAYRIYVIMKTSLRRQRYKEKQKTVPKYFGNKIISLITVQSARDIPNTDFSKYPLISDYSLNTFPIFIYITPVISNY